MNPPDPSLWDPSIRPPVPGLLLAADNARVLVCVRVTRLLKRLRLGLDLSPETFAENGGMGRSTIRYIERQDYITSFEVAVRLLHCVSLPVWMLTFLAEESDIADADPDTADPLTAEAIRGLASGLALAKFGSLLF